MLETRWSKIAALPWVLVFPGPQKVSDNIVRSKIQHCRTKLIVCSFESSWRENRPGLFTILYYQYFEKIQTKNKMAVIVVSFPENISKSIVNTAFWLVQSLFSSSRAFGWAYDELCTTTLKFWPWWWGSLTFWGPGGDQISKLSRHFWSTSRVSGMVGNLIFACQLARPKKRFRGTP